MTPIDFHSHHPALCGEVVLQQGVHTWGIHPWQAADVPPVEPPTDVSWLAIGECGLDKLCDAPWVDQLSVFRSHIALSERLGLPLLLHVVKAQAELLALQRESRSSVPWIFHGFRGKPEQMRQLVRHGWYLSFGFRFNEESLRQCPLERLLIETDDVCRPVQCVYERVACLRGVSPDFLAEKMWENAEKLA